MSCLRPFLLCGAILFAVVFATHAKAEDRVNLSEERLPIAQHLTRPGSTKFLEPPPKQDELMVGVPFHTRLEQLPPGTGAIDMLPNCPGESVDRHPLSEVNSITKKIDFLYFSPLDADQLKRAGEWPGIAVPFIEGWRVNPYKTPDNYQDFARVIHLRCLPVRFHVIKDGSTWYTEYREGERAWDQK